MTDAGIPDGDIFVVRRQDTAEPGDIVVALIGEEATVKRLYRPGRRHGFGKVACSRERGLSGGTHELTLS